MASSSSSAADSKDTSLVTSRLAFRKKKTKQQNEDPRYLENLKVQFAPEHQVKTLYIGNMDKRLSEYALLKLFGKFGEIVRCQYLWHHSGDMRGAPRGYSFLEFKTREEAAAAQKKMDGRRVLGRNLVVRYAAERKARNEVNVEYTSLADRRKAEITKGSIHISTEDKIRAIEEKLKRMDDTRKRKHSGDAKGAPQSKHHNKHQKGSASSSSSSSSSGKS